MSGLTVASYVVTALIVGPVFVHLVRSGVKARQKAAQDREVASNAAHDVAVMEKQVRDYVPLHKADRVDVTNGLLWLATDSVWIKLSIRKRGLRWDVFMDLPNGERFLVTPEVLLNMRAQAQAMDDQFIAQVLTSHSSLMQPAVTTS